MLGHRGWRIEYDSSTWLQRSRVVLAWLALTIVGTWSVSAMKDRGNNQYVNELAGNGIYQFFAAYRAGSLRLRALLPDTARSPKHLLKAAPLAYHAPCPVHERGPA